MVEQKSEQLDRIFRALSDSTRRSILRRLTLGDALVTEIAEPFDISLAAVSKHLRVLEEAGLVRRTVKGREHRCALNSQPLSSAADWVEAYRGFWEIRPDATDSAKRRRSG